MTTTTTTTGSAFTCTNNETIYGVWNTIAGGDSTQSTQGTQVGNYFAGQTPPYACDNNFNTLYLNFGPCNWNNYTLQCGINTGFYWTPKRGASLIIGLQVCTAVNLPQRDPITVTFEGSNQPASALSLGSSWTLLYSGASGLVIDPGRIACGMPQFFASSTVWYVSYRFLVTSKRGVETATWYSEVQLLGY